MFDYINKIYLNKLKRVSIEMKNNIFFQKKNNFTFIRLHIYKTLIQPNHPGGSAKGTALPPLPLVAAYKTCVCPEGKIIFVVPSGYIFFFTPP